MPTGSKNRIIQGCGSQHIAVQAHDWEASLRLYRDVLGMTIVEQWGTPRRMVESRNIYSGI